jgi:hypothetical protein
MQRTQRSAAQGAKVRDGAPHYGVEAEFADMHSARLAVEALGKAGIEGDNISLTGRAAKEAAQPPDADLRAKTREMDTNLAKHMLSSVGAWTVGGVIVGALVGIPLSIALMAALAADVTVERVLAGVFLSALALGIVGWLIPLTSYASQAAPPWELTFAESAEGQVRVGVHSLKPDDIELADTTLRGQKPLRIYRDARGRDSS